MAWTGKILRVDLSSGNIAAEPRERMVARMMNETAGGLIKRWCQQRGVKVLTSTGVTGLEAGDPLGVELDDGQTLAADLVIRATGVRPNVDFLTASGIDLDQGVLVNECLRPTSRGSTPPATLVGVGTSRPVTSASRPSSLPRWSTGVWRRTIWCVNSSYHTGAT